ncbi:PKD domain-containing protein [Flavilitoribacter nigricans]|uniref:PKD domain-containing protein n=1 Tax=Flavilitoribacter nigricans (strain ATCC 23147 / DSM 23189 / NBRC 102662 / NCIMB 1420 / SS-2) TaxID=1122177 RepID=A0A2D0NJJ6_FLAN2|nr:PKD domain-containing protein [Flavilitoribacter nigricans]PHN08674.1 hypothetical protein CRP01_01820 [Flavilitoribacter nigricans DSM 23189 = NBRC 102662]
MKNFNNIKWGISQLVFLLITLFVSCSPEALVDLPPFSPTVEISSSVDAENPLMVSFTSKTTNAFTLTWDFGDGNSSNEPNPVHTYATGGDYAVMLTVVGEEGSIPAIAEKTVVVREKVSAKVTGSIIGHPGSWDGVNGLITTAFDGDLNTFVDAPGEFASTGFVGYDFGAENAPIIDLVKFAPRPGFEGRLVGGEIRGSNDPSLTEYTVLYTITEAPAAGELAEAPIAGGGSYQYVYYYTAPDGYCNIAELEFYGEFDLGLINMSNWTEEVVTPGISVTMTEYTINFSGGASDWPGSHIYQEISVEPGTYQLTGSVTVHSVINDVWSELIFSEQQPQAGQDYAPGIPYQVVYSTWNGSPTAPGTYSLGDTNRGGEFPVDGIYTFDAATTFYIVIKSGGAQPYDLTWNNLAFKKVR